MPHRFNVNPSNRKIYGKTDSPTLAPSIGLSSKPLIKTIQFRYNSPLHFFRGPCLQNVV